MVSRIVRQLRELQKHLGRMEIGAARKLLLAMVIPNALLNQSKHNGQQEPDVQERGHELAESNKKLAYEIRQCEALLEATPDQFWRFNSQGVCVAARVTQEYPRLLPVSDYPGTPLEDWLPEDLVWLYRKAINAALNSKEIQTIEYEIEVPGQKLFEEARIIAIAEDEVLAVVRNITEQVEARRKLQEACEIMASAERISLVGSLAAGIAHDLNQPLNSIKISVGGLLYLMGQGIDQSRESLIAELESIMEQVSRTEKIITNSRAAINHYVREIDIINLNEIVAKTLAFVKKQPLFNGVQIETSLAESLPTINANVSQLEQVLLNILQNAAQAIYNAGRQNGLIRVITAMNKEEVVICIEDNGTGISSEKLGDIMRPFATSAARPDNMGLGLAISKTIMASFGGTIRAQNNCGQGAKIVLTFPLSDDREVYA